MDIVIVTDESEVNDLVESLRTGAVSPMSYSDNLKATLPKEILDEDVEYTENDGETLDEQFEKMTGAKRTTVRIVSALLLLLIVAGVVFGTDAIMNFIKEFFG